MNLRKSCLPPGWYPQNPAKIDEFLGNYIVSKAGKTTPSAEKPHKSRVFATIAPHAGWYYSGTFAAQAAAALASQVKQGTTVAVIGGHLPEGMPALFAMEEAVFSPMGNLTIDSELRDALLDAFRTIPGLKTAEDRYQDNTVEVLLPMVKYFFPDSRLLWLRPQSTPLLLETAFPALSANSSAASVRLFWWAKA